MSSTLVRMVLYTRPLVSLSRVASVRPWYCYCTCSTLQVLASRVPVRRNTTECSHNGKRWNTIYPVRYIMKASKKREALLKDEDHIPDGYEIVYRAPLVKYIQFGQTVSYLSFLMVGGVSVFSYLTGSSIFQFPIPVTGTEVFSNMNFIQMFVFLGLFLCINFVFQRVACAYAYRIYRKNDVHILIKNGYLPFKTKQLTFSKGEFKKSPSKLLNLLWSDSVFKAAGHTTIVFEEYFRTPQDFEDISGSLGE